MENELNYFIDHLPKRDILEEIFLELKELKEYVRESGVQDIIRTEISDEIEDLYSDSISSF